MKFGQSTDEAIKQEEERGASAGKYMKYLRDGDNTVRILDEPDKWVWFWEHFNTRQGGWPYPCTGDRNTCPGCTSPNPKESRASRRVAMNAYDGQYTNVWKLPKTVAEKLRNRHARIGSITDRDYTITRLKSGTGDSATYDFDLEGGEKEPLAKEVLDQVKEHITDPETILASMYEDAFPSESSGIVAKAEETAEPEPEAESKSEDEAEETEIAEEDLRAMSPDELRALCETEGFGAPPKLKKTTDSIVDWMLTQ